VGRSSTYGRIPLADGNKKTPCKGLVTLPATATAQQMADFKEGYTNLFMTLISCVNLLVAKNRFISIFMHNHARHGLARDLSFPSKQFYDMYKNLCKNVIELIS
jgi:hypothetical protein